MKVVRQPLGFGRTLRCAEGDARVSHAMDRAVRAEGA